MIGSPQYTRCDRCSLKQVSCGLGDDQYSEKSDLAASCVMFALLKLRFLSLPDFNYQHICDHICDYEHIVHFGNLSDRLSLVIIYFIS